mmetsp:Transcript_37562/g.117679  ORF Transcript_37562/g.117679 Transcript_37562/m.117679 type:complete len:129 (+) Transcript_37562:628-1014(+)
MQKGISFSDTFGSSDEPATLRRQLWTMCEGLGASMLAAGLVGEKLTLKRKDSSVEVRSRAAPRGGAFGSAGELYARALPLLERELRRGGAAEGGVPDSTRSHARLRLRSSGTFPYDGGDVRWYPASDT